MCVELPLGRQVGRRHPSHGVEVARTRVLFDDRREGHAQDLDERIDGSSHIFSSIFGSLQTVQRAEHWGVILAIQTFCGIHVGIDFLNSLPPTHTLSFSKWS